MYTTLLFITAFLIKQEKKLTIINWDRKRHRFERK